MPNIARRPAIAVLAALSAVAVLTAAQDPQTRPVFRAGVDLIHLDVSVLDKGRRPVRGLTVEDFTVQEDGRPQPISAFLAIDVPPAPPAPPAKWMRDVTPDIQTNDLASHPEGRLFVLLLDDAMLPADPGAVQNAKKIARGVVDRLAAHDQLAVVFTFSSKNSQDYTTDRTKLLRAIDSLQAGSARHMLGWDATINLNPRDPNSLQVPAVDGDAGLRVASLATLKGVAETLIAAPQRRKALIYVSTGLTVDIESDARPIRVSMTDPGRAIWEANHRLVADLPELYQRMSRANVTIYPVDPCGIDGLAGYVARTAQGLPSLRRAMTPVLPDFNWLSPDRTPRPEDLAKHKATLDMDFLMTAAASTGGRAIVNTNEFDTGLDGVFAENGSYYLLGYAKPGKDGAGSFHRITVKVNRPDVTVRTRSGYETEKEQPASTEGPAVTALNRDSAGPIAATGLPLQVAVSPLAVPGQTDPVVTVVLGLREPTPAARTAQSIEMLTSIFTADGIAVGSTWRQTATFMLLPDAGFGGEVRYELLTRFTLKPGRYEMRVAAHRQTDGQSGSVYADVDVPDFSKLPVALAGVWLEATPGSSAVPRDALKLLLPVVPTASREFGARDQVAAFFRVYQGGNARLLSVPLTVRITNERDEIVADATGDIDAERFSAVTRSADHRFAIPVAALTPGRYLLTFEAKLGQSVARRDVTFSVR